ncbi:MAG TPA: S41 family peptidase [Bryobacteraceae bacterium]|jgi:tricorn protease|nr:S41 family peptidase [Bryobacteraceae bacterium]
MRLSSSLLLFALFAPILPAQNKGYYRYPALSHDRIVFTAEGDLWTVSTEGGLATRLTSSLGQEYAAAVSPDGKTVAFSADYEGPTEVYTMPIDGGIPQRRTFDGQAIVQGWMPDGKILYASYRYATLPDAQLLSIDAQNRISILPLSQASQGCFDGNGTLFFTRFPFQGSYAKRYRGGTAQSLWKYVPGQEATALTADYTGTSKNAMYWQGRIYFLSDRDGTMNLWSMDESGRKLRQHTHQQGWDIKDASLSDGQIVYQLGTDLHLFNIGKNQDRAIPIELPSDFDSLREHWIKEPLKYTSAVHFSNDGEKIVLTARGRVFVAPVKHGRFVDISEHRPGRFREARLSADGKSVLVFSTESGEVELWKYPANGVGAGEAVTAGGKVLRWEGVPSPDGKWIVHQDKNNRLYLLDLASKTEKRIAESNPDNNSDPAFGGIRWSPDSRWVLFSEEADNGFIQLMLYGIENGRTVALTTDRYNTAGADWSEDGKWIYFLSDRSLNTVVKSPWGNRQPDPFFDRTNKLYALALKRGQVSPFEPADELHPAKTEETPKPGTDQKKNGPPKVEIELDGIETRLIEVPAPAGNYSDLQTAGKRLCWIDNDAADPAKNTLQCLDVANKGDAPETLLDAVRSFEVSGDGKKILARTKNDLLVFDSSMKADALKSPKTMADSKVDLGSWTFSVIPAEEYREAFLDAWRLHRDYFYDPHMHGINWPAMRDKYGELLNRVRDREELDDLISDMVSELSALHTFVFGGDIRKSPDQIELASLGALLEPAANGKGWTVKHIYRTDPDRPDQLSPLARQGVELEDGDTILALNGRDLDEHTNPGEVLRGQAGKQVLLHVLPKGKNEPRDVIARPIAIRADAELRYSEWEWTRRQTVEQRSRGSIGYVHLRAMGPNDINQWVEQFSPVYDRAGLIVDVRHNRGGNIDSWVLGKLMRKAWMYWQPRAGRASWNMQEAFRGPVVVLCDQWTASDGEAFSEGFKRLGLGKVIGTRTWGGEIWLSAGNRLADNGIASAAELGVYGPEGKWLIEGHGVDPDVVVDNLPHASFEGHDAQLDAALEYLEKQIEAHPNPVPPHPPYPNKAFAPKSKDDM